MDQIRLDQRLDKRLDQIRDQIRLDQISSSVLQVDIEHEYTKKLGLGETDPIEKAIDLDGFYKSVEWDIMDVPGKKSIIRYPCCEEPYNDITYNITIRFVSFILRTCDLLSEGQVPISDVLGNL